MVKLENRLTNKQKAIILNNFGKIKIKDIEKLSEVPCRTITQFLKIHQLKLTKEERYKILALRKRKYECNDLFFNNLNPISCYWAGFIAADGNISDLQNRLTIKLKSTDYTHLEKFKLDINFNGKIVAERNVKNGKQYFATKIYITSQQLLKDLLINFNIAPKKSLTYTYPDLSGNLQDCFIKGYFDGDGSRYLKYKKHEIVSFYGTQSTNQWIKGRIDYLFSKNSGSIFNKGKITCYQLNYTASKFFIKYFGNLKTPELDRKWRAFEGE